MKKITLLFLIALLIAACDEDNLTVDNDNDVLDVPLPELPIASDNPLTAEGKQLGRMLFYEKKLSRTNTIACASCHHQELAFSDPNRVSFGVDSLTGNRQAMGLFNLAFSGNGFFWDGRVDVLRHQSLLPIQDELEMDETLENVVAKLSKEQLYLDQFTKAFGTPEITEEKVGLALEQFLISLVSETSKYDLYKQGSIDLTASELNGEKLFLNRGCDNCHAGSNFDEPRSRFLNNGLDIESDFLDLGRELITNDPDDRAKFKVPSLRNIAVTAPYMHDGRFATLEEVLQHYATGVQESSTLAGPTILGINLTLGGFDLTSSEKEDLLNFLGTLTDEDFLSNPDFSNPF